MVLLTTTSRILSAIESIPPSNREDLELPSSPTLDSPISHDQIIRTSRYFREGRNDHEHDVAETENGGHDHDNDRDQVRIPPSSTFYTLNELLRGTKIYIPPPSKKPEPTAEYLAQKERLLSALQTDTYNNLVSPVQSTIKPGITGSSSVFSSSTPTVSALHDPSSSTRANAKNNPEDEDPLTPSLVINIFLSVLITGFSVYWALSVLQTPDFLLSISGNIRSSAEGSSSERASALESEPIRVLLSLFAALGIGVAEVVIYAFYLRKIDRARARERKVKERKEVVGVVTDGTKEKNVHVEMKEKEEIWGRGVNGGVRRRVKEKWEEEERHRNVNNSRTSSLSVL